MVNLQFITHQTERYSYLESARMALEGGCKWIQLRMKEATLEEVETVALQLKTLCKEHEATLILDDHVELVKKLEVDGVHLGKQDMPVDQARQMLGEAFIIGGTANTFEDVMLHYHAGADYLGIGPFRFTTTKKKLSPVLGLEGYTSILSQMREKNIKLPVVAIGGITVEDIPVILRTGVNGIAISGTILQAENPTKETRRIINSSSKNI
ncbi:thiamine phosphate synthase [uncultured Bacteroides sp.]|uniref:thiamine phosphate synthase n=1 Tax=uncultured Bacteroides sp. TaxID=162156 RepID=UPI0025EE72C5|nr:thiamine phosphate synthase [uncultured Bacteroides sp.]